MTAPRPPRLPARALALLAGLAGLAAAPAIATAADASVVTPRVVGGGVALPGSWPSIAALVRSDLPNAYEGHFCGGTLIDPSWVLTAAHCVRQSFTDRPEKVHVVLGRRVLSSSDGFRHAVDRIHVHPGYTGEVGPHDVALVHLALPSAMPPMPIVAPGRESTWAPGVPSRVAGWGLLSAEGLHPDDLREAIVPIVDDGSCGIVHGPRFAVDSMVCAGFAQGGVDTCTGDSGGPLTVVDGAVEVLVGATSFGVPCARPGSPGVYVRLASYREWISDVIGWTRPSAPSGVGVAPGVSSLTVTWTPAASAGSKPISGYRVAVQPGNVVRYAAAGATQLRVVDLAAHIPTTVSVSAASSAGHGPSLAAPGSVVLDGPPVAQALPVISGLPRKGETLRASQGEWLGAQSVSLRWQRAEDGSSVFDDIPDAAGAGYTLTGDDVGARIRVVATAANAFGAVRSESATVSSVLAGPPSSTAPPAVQGAPRVGATLAATTGGWSEEPTSFSYQWHRCDAAGDLCLPLAGKVDPRYTPVAADAGARLRVSVTATTTGGQGSATSAPSAAVVDLPLLRRHGGSRVLRSRRSSTIVLRVTAGAPAWLKVRVVGPGRRPVTVIPNLSAIAGRGLLGRPTALVRTRVLRAGTVSLRLGVAGWRGAPRPVSVAMTATDARGRTETLTVPARVRLGRL